MNKKYFIIFTIIIAFMMTGCGSKENIKENSIGNTNSNAVSEIVVEKDISEVTENISDEIEQVLFESLYHFYDVFRNEYEMEINRAVSQNTLSEDGYLYVGYDALGNVLSDVEITKDTDIFIPGSEATGYTGIIKYEDDKYTSRFGIDVSKFQGNINWEKVKAAGVEFVFVRVGFRGYGLSGSLSEDALYRRNIEGALNQGLDVGVYFYSQAINEEEAVEEADFIESLISGYDISLPVVYDPEHVLNDTARTDDVSGEQFTLNAIAFSNRIKELGHEPMIYANMLWEANELDLSRLSDVKIWYADYELKPQSPYRFNVWQYSQAGKISGIDGSVDLNMMVVLKSDYE